MKNWPSKAKRPPKTKAGANRKICETLPEREEFQILMTALRTQMGVPNPKSPIEERKQGINQLRMQHEIMGRQVAETRHVRGKEDGPIQVNPAKPTNLFPTSATAKRVKERHVKKIKTADAVMRTKI
jgi:hypothetical protein